MLEGVVSFSPSGLRPAYQKVLEKAKKVETMQADRIRTLIDSPDFDAMLDSAMEKALNLPSGSPIETTGDVGNLLESAASTLPTNEQLAGTA